MNYLFLDIDGVLNSYSGLIKRGGQGLVGIFDEHEEVLDWVLQKMPDLKIVISSTWRISKSLDDFKYNLFSYTRIGNAVIGITPKLRGVQRGDEIQRWLNENASPTDRYVILDDDNDMGDISHRLVQTNGDYGLTYVEGYAILEKFLDLDARKLVWTTEGQV